MDTADQMSSIFVRNIENKQIATILPYYPSQSIPIRLALFPHSRLDGDPSLACERASTLVHSVQGRSVCNEGDASLWKTWNFVRGPWAK